MDFWPGWTTEEGHFKDPTTTAAAVGCQVHYSIIIELNLDSYRLESSHKQRTKSPKA